MKIKKRNYGKKMIFFDDEEKTNSYLGKVHIIEAEIGLLMIVFHADSTASTFRSVAPTVKEWELKNQNLKIACISAKMRFLGRVQYMN